MLKSQWSNLCIIGILERRRESQMNVSWKIVKDNFTRGSEEGKIVKMFETWRRENLLCLPSDWLFRLVGVGKMKQWLLNFCAWAMAGSWEEALVRSKVINLDLDLGIRFIVLCRLFKEIRTFLLFLSLKFQGSFGHNECEFLLAFMSTEPPTVRNLALPVCLYLCLVASLWLAGEIYLQLQVIWGIFHLSVFQYYSFYKFSLYWKAMGVLGFILITGKFNEKESLPTS